MLGPLTIRRARRDAGAAGLAQGARAARLSGAGPACRPAQPALRTAVGRPQRSARRAALVPQQDQRPRRRAPIAARVDTAGDTVRLDLADCFVDAVEIARATQTGHRDAIAPERLRRTVPRSFAGEFLEGLEIDRKPGLQQLAHRPAAAVPRLPCGAAGTAGRRAPAAMRCSSISRSGWARTVRPARPRDAAQCARPARPDPRGRGASGGHRPPVRGRGSRLQRRLRDAWRAARAHARQLRRTPR